jgi:NAD-dependent SIR2 family protein deacetylase
MKRTAIFGLEFMVCCPYCGEVLPAPNGTFRWKPEEIKEATFPHCNECGRQSLKPRQIKTPC